ncbi:hypothetical protein BACI71_90203 [Bacillus mycoides]|uniref:Uncharacterized protein n=1 Tax=Bacillus mycoides TaxID=1405 RepID=A0A654C7K7_BACMY|nr:hypothetical protein BACI71_90203 [Bacillus mycoides]
MFSFSYDQESLSHAVLTAHDPSLGSGAKNTVIVYTENIHK